MLRRALMAPLMVAPALVLGVSALDAEPIKVQQQQQQQQQQEEEKANGGISPAQSSDLMGTLRGMHSHIVGAVFDVAYGTITGHVRGALHFGTGGWGNLERAHAGMKRLRAEHPVLVHHCETQLVIRWRTGWERTSWGGWRRDGEFESPLAFLCGAESAEEQLFREGLRVPFRHVLPPDALAEVTADEAAGAGAMTGTARPAADAVEQTSPLAVRRVRDDVPLCIHLPCNGDKGFAWREKHFAEHLAAKEGIGSIIWEAPYMGQRRDGVGLSGTGPTASPFHTFVSTP